MKYTLLFLIIIISLIACENDSLGTMNDVKNAIIVEIKIPAGQAEAHSFLPYPGNLGHLSGHENTEILVLSESVKVGTKMQVRPLGALVLKENNQIRNIIIASPVDSLLQLTTTTNFQEFITKNAGEKQIIQDWFLYQKGLGKTELIGWEDEKYSWGLVETEGSM